MLPIIRSRSNFFLLTSHDKFSLGQILENSWYFGWEKVAFQIEPEIRKAKKSQKILRDLPDGHSYPSPLRTLLSFDGIELSDFERSNNALFLMC